MSKMRLYKFWNENGDEKEKEAISLKSGMTFQFKAITKIK